MSPLPLAPPGMKVKVKVAQSCPTLCDPMDYTVHGILQARVLEWVAFSACSSGARGRHRFDSWIREIPWRRAWQPTWVSLLENRMDRGAWWAIVLRAAKSQTQLSN